jgi:hypothetical protein
MADRKLTLFELHFDEGFQVGPKTVGFGGESDDEPEDEAEESGLLGLGGDEEDDEDSADVEEIDDTDDFEDDDSSPVSLLLGVVALALVAAVVRRLVGDDEDLEIEAPEEQEDVEEFESAD